MKVWSWKTYRLNHFSYKWYKLFIQTGEIGLDIFLLLFTKYICYAPFNLFEMLGFKGFVEQNILDSAS